MKNENFKKMKKNPWDIIISHKCTKNHDHTVYGSWDMTCDRCTCYFSFWAILVHFTSLTAQKMKMSKKWKKHLEMSSFYTRVPKIMIVCYTAPEIWHVTYVIVIFHFGLFFALLTPPAPFPPPPNTQKNQNFKKLKLYTCVPKIMIRWCTVPEIWCATDGRTDGQKKLLEVCAPPKRD